MMILRFTNPHKQRSAKWRVKSEVQLATQYFHQLIDIGVGNERPELATAQKKLIAAR